MQLLLNIIVVVVVVVIILLLRMKIYVNQQMSENIKYTKDTASQKHWDSRTKITLRVKQMRNPSNHAKAWIDLLYSRVI